jgi:hypothetical protein
VTDAFDFTPYLHVFSAEKRSGKSRLLDVFELLVKNPWRDSGATEAVLFRKIERDKPTLLSDEIDTVFHSNANDGLQNIRRMFNLGFTRGNKVSRCEGANTKFDIVEFDPFCPKVLCGIGRCLPDTVADRALPIELVRQTDEHKAKRFRLREARQLVARIRAEIQAWSGQPDLIGALNSARPRMPAKIRDRQEEICEPLIAIADLAGGNWPESARAALVKLCGQEEDASIGVKLLAAIKSIFDETSEDRITTPRLLEALTSIEDEPWALMFEDALKHGNLQTAAAKLARLLKEYKTPEGKKLKPHTIRVGDETPKGFYRSDFELEWKRYLPPSPETPQQAQQVQHTTENEDTTENIAPDVVAPVNGQAATEISLGKSPNVAAVAAVAPVWEDEW